MSTLPARWRRLTQYAPNAYELRELAIFGSLLPFVWLPEAAGAWAMERIARFQMSEGRPYRREVGSKAPPVVGCGGPKALVAAEVGLLAERLARLRELAPPKRAPVAVEGMERVHAALAEGRGVVLWVHVCSGASVFVKRALAERGYALVHLSRPSHPFTGTPFGRRFVNPILRRPETRALKQRVEIPDSGPTGALRQLRRSLAANEVVSITVAVNATRITATPCLDGTLLLPAGPVELAWASGAALLPVFTFGAPWEPVVVIGESLAVTGRDTIAVAKAHQAAAAWLEPMVRRHPEAWWGWRSGGWRPASPEGAEPGSDQSLEQDMTGS